MFMTEMTHACVPCGLTEPRRPAYFDGQLLLARDFEDEQGYHVYNCLLYTSPSPRDGLLSRMPSSA